MAPWPGCILIARRQKESLYKDAITKDAINNNDINKGGTNETKKEKSSKLGLAKPKLGNLAEEGMKDAGLEE